MDNKIIIVGVGGTGANLAAMLSRFINAQWEIVLVDADRVEEHNLERQAFQKHDIGEFKAEAMSRKLNTATSATTSFKNRYIKDTKLLEQIAKKANEIVVFGCVDNHPARMKIEKFFKNLDTQSRWLYVDAANELEDGEIVSVHKKFHWGYRDVTYLPYDGVMRSDMYPKIKRSRKGDVTNKSCAVEISEGNEQQYSTNLQSAIICFRIFQNWLNQKEVPNTVHFDWESWGMKSA